MSRNHQTLKALGILHRMIVELCDYLMFLFDLRNRSLLNLPRPDQLPPVQDFLELRVDLATASQQVNLVVEPGLHVNRLVMNGVLGA